jgi:hypothetical protein
MQLLQQAQTSNRAQSKTAYGAFVNAHRAFEKNFSQALQHAKDAGTALLRLRTLTELKGTALFDHVRSETGVEVSNRSMFLYVRIASRFNELQIVAGEKLSEMSLSSAVKLLAKEDEFGKPKGSKSAKPKNKPTPTSGQPATETPSNAPPNASTDSTVKGETDAKPQQGVPTEEPIKIEPPFDQPTRLANVFAQNGPASTPMQLMTNLVIPALKKVAEAGVSESEIPFLAKAIREAAALFDVLKQKYPIG